MSKNITQFHKKIFLYFKYLILIFPSEILRPNKNRFLIQCQLMYISTTQAVRILT